MAVLLLSACGSPEFVAPAPDYPVSTSAPSAPTGPRFNSITNPLNAGTSQLTALVSGPMGSFFGYDPVNFRLRLSVIGYPNPTVSEAYVNLYNDGTSLSHIMTLPARPRTGTADYIQLEICSTLGNGCDVTEYVKFFVSDNGVPKRLVWCTPVTCVFNLDFTLSWVPVNIQPATVTFSPYWGATLNVGGASATYEAIAADANGQTVPYLPIVWTSANPSIATVDANGVVSPVAVGTTSVTATVSGVSGSFPVSVNDMGISVSISGPTRIKPTQGCTYLAQVGNLNLTQPLTYAWTGPGSQRQTGTDPQFFTNRSTTNFVLDLTVTDAAGRTGSVSKPIGVAAANPSCVQ